MFLPVASKAGSRPATIALSEQRINGQLTDTKLIRVFDPDRCRTECLALRQLVYATVDAGLSGPFQYHQGGCRVTPPVAAESLAVSLLDATDRAMRDACSEWWASFAVERAFEATFEA